MLHFLLVFRSSIIKHGFHVSSEDTPVLDCLPPLLPLINASIYIFTDLFTTNMFCRLQLKECFTWCTCVYCKSLFSLIKVVDL